VDGARSPLARAAGDAGPQARRVRVEHVMGTTVSIDVRGPFAHGARLDGAETASADALGDAIEAAVAWLHDVDERFSPYQPGSEVSRVIAGTLSLEDAHPDVRAMVTLADRVRDETGGFFDARSHRPGSLGRPDPTGVVKGWAVDEAAAILRLAGARNLQVVAGGDLVAFGEADAGRAWRVGVRHPDREDRVAAVLLVRDLAVATSGLYERGDHIVDPHTGAVPRGLCSLTVVGPTLAMADAYATGAFAMGERGIAWVGAQPGFGALGITAGDRVVWTDLVEDLLDHGAGAVRGAG
jgi:FAD:protein FMN transferase